MSVKNLYYFGKNPTKDVADVPSGANYRMLPGNRLVVFSEDVPELLARQDAAGNPLFGVTATRPTAKKVQSKPEEVEIVQNEAVVAPAKNEAVVAPDKKKVKRPAKSK